MFCYFQGGYNWFVITTCEFSNNFSGRPWRLCTPCYPHFMGPKKLIIFRNRRKTQNGCLLGIYPHFCEGNLSIYKCVCVLYLPKKNVGDMFFSLSPQNRFNCLVVETHEIWNPWFHPFPTPSRTDTKCRTC